MDCFGSKKCFRGALIAFIGDTPASGLVGGFKEGVGGALRCCRSCMIKSDDLCTKVCPCALVNPKLFVSLDLVHRSLCLNYSQGIYLSITSSVNF